MDPQPSQYPSPIIDKNSNEPGFWAHLAQSNPWLRGTRSATRKGTRHNLLRELPLCREPALRVQTNSADFYFTLGRKNANIEALLAQSVGVEMPPSAACQSCKEGYGKFVSCVFVPSIKDKMPSCANCHWGAQAHRCTFNADPPIIPVQFDARLLELDEALQKEIKLRDQAEEAVTKAITALSIHNQNIQTMLSEKVVLLAQQAAREGEP